MGCPIRQSTAADYPRMVAIINAESKEPSSVEGHQRQERVRRPEDAYLRLAATDDAGEILGYGFAYADPIQKPKLGYVPHEGSFHLCRALR